MRQCRHEEKKAENASRDLIHLQFLLEGISDLLFLKFFPKKIHCAYLRFGHALYVDIHPDADVDQRTFFSVALMVFTTPASCLRREWVVGIGHPKTHIRKPRPLRITKTKGIADFSELIVGVEIRNFLSLRKYSRVSRIRSSSASMT